MGYEKVAGIIEADEFLAGNSQGGDVLWADEFFVSFLGKPRRQLLGCSSLADTIWA